MDPDVKEILVLSLDDIDIVNGFPTGYSQQVYQNIQKYSKSIKISMEGMEAQAFLFFSEIEKRRKEKKNKGIVMSKGEKKLLRVYREN